MSSSPTHYLPCEVCPEKQNELLACEQEDLIRKMTEEFERKVCNTIVINLRVNFYCVYFIFICVDKGK